MSVFVLDASYTLTWCFPDRATPNTDATLKRLEAGLDSAVVPAIWQIEVTNVLGKAVVRRKLNEERALEIWQELVLLPIRQSESALEVPELSHPAVRHNIIVYDACYLQEARLSGLPLATNDFDLKAATESYGITVMTP